MEPEVHIAGIVIFISPPYISAVTCSVESIPLATVHAGTPDGRLIVTLETESTKQILDYLDALRALPGVANVALVYQHAEPLSALEQEVQP